jgi:hypothetical protein
VQRADKCPKTLLNFPNTAMPPGQQTPPAKPGMPTARMAISRPAADAVNAFIADLDQLTRQAAALNPESLEPHMDNLSPEIRGSLEYRVTALSDALEATRMMCQQLLHRLRPGESEH